jgi:4-hydroxybutyrate dehydrogenase/sulfolactaldehyde 3-reductase
MSNVAFVGLGMMGLPMAHNILKGGHSVTGFDLSSDAMKHHEANGGSVTSTAAKAVEDAEFIITMVPKGEHVISALFGPDGIVEGMSSNSMIIDMSTIHPLDTDSIRKELSSKGISMLDAPVGRTSDHAKLGKLLVMVGGEKDDIERARPVLECMGDTIVDCGGPGMGARMKIINNYMSISLNALTAEALALAESTGLEIPLAIEVMSGTLAGQGHMSNSYPAKVLKGDLSPAFMLDLAHKDLGLALDLANDLRVPMPLGAAAREVYSVARGHDRGAQDWTALYETVREISGLNK